MCVAYHVFHLIFLFFDIRAIIYYFYYYYINMRGNDGREAPPSAPLPSDRGSFGLAIIPSLVNSLLADFYTYFPY